MYEHRKALEREFESQMHTFDKEMERLKTKHRQELESKVIFFLLTFDIFDIIIIYFLFLFQWREYDFSSLKNNCRKF